MHHKLDIHPIPEEVLYVNDLLLAGKVPYETKDDMEKAVTGKKKSEGGILPDDNVRIYVPMDLNAEGIMWRLYALYGSLGYPTEANKSSPFSHIYQHNLLLSSRHCLCLLLSRLICLTMKQLVYFAAEMYNWTALFPVDTLTAVIPFHVFSPSDAHALLDNKYQAHSLQ